MQSFENISWNRRSMTILIWPHGLTNFNGWFFVIKSIIVAKFQKYFVKPQEYMKILNWPHCAIAKLQSLFVVAKYFSYLPNFFAIKSIIVPKFQKYFVKPQKDNNSDLTPLCNCQLTKGGGLSLCVWMGASPLTYCVTWNI